MVDNNVIQEFVDAIKQEPEDTNRVYTAIVSNVDTEGVIWVNLAGSDKETPTASTSAEVKRGDVVNVEWRNNKLYIVGNSSNPSAGIIRVDAVERASETARMAAESAIGYANEASSEAGRAKGAADEALGYAKTAEDNAGDAIDFAQQAQQTANNARGYLTEVENVVGVLAWIAQYGEYDPTQDTVVTEGKWYFELDEQGNYVIVELPQDANPQEEGVYELKEMEKAIGKYVSSHLFLDQTGLHVSLDRDNGSELILNGTSILMKDSNGDTIAEYSGTVVLGNKYGGQPFIELSPSNGLEFYQDTQTRVAHINQSTLFIGNAEITNSLRIGKFLWVVKDENRISLRYEPEEV